MALTHSPQGELGSLAPGFKLKGTDGVSWGLGDFRDCRALVLVFMCNHCPYVKAVRGRISGLAAWGQEQARGVQVVGICSNDSIKYPQDDFAAMQREAAEQGYRFPYLWDETQSVARAYGAVCTPDFYVYGNRTQPRSSAEFVLKYRGRLDDHWKDESAVTSQDLKAALEEILAGREPSSDQIPSMGCSIKWK